MAKKTNKTFRRKYKRNYKKNNRKSNKGNVVLYKLPKPTVQKGDLPFGLSYLARLKYGFATVLTGNISQTSVTHTLNMNSLYDPDNTAAGHQPYQFDQLAAIYERYRVTGCKVDITFSDPSGDGCYVGYRARNNANTVLSSGKSLEYLMEMGDTKIVPLNNTGSQKTKFSIYYPIEKLFGVSKVQLKTDPNFQALYTSDPFHLALLDLILLDGTGTSNTVRVTVDLKFYSVFFERRTITQS